AEARSLRVRFPDDRLRKDPEVQAAPGPRATPQGAKNMTRRIIAAILFVSARPLYAQRLSPKREELTAADFVRALDGAANSCVLHSAGEGEISNVMASRPDLAHPERSSTQSGRPQSKWDRAYKKTFSNRP